MTTLKQRAFAFDGTVEAIAAPQLSGGLVTQQVTFRVQEWFHGGKEPTVTIEMETPPSSPLPGTTTGTSVQGRITYEIGTRLLISGEPRWGGGPLDGPLAWDSCGFSRNYDESTATQWRQAFTS